MSNMNVRCPACGVEYELDRNLINHKVECSECEAKFTFACEEQNVISRLVTPPPHAQTASPAPSQPLQDSWLPGNTVLGEYKVERMLGQGGMGQVWLVTSASTNRHFAVKRALLKDTAHRKAFLAELQTWIDLPEHPNIVPCRFFRTVGDEIVIFADYVDGGSLAEWIAKGKLTDLAQVLDVAIQFAWGLHAIHERGLIHQDVKPANVLMNAEGVPMVADFGLARARMRGGDGAFASPALPQGKDRILVSFGGMTPAYASPEQHNKQPLSRKTDVWSWGVSIMDLFMGGVSCPHGGHIAAEVLEGLTENERQEIPAEVSAVLKKCFSRDPDQRWKTTREAADQLQHIYQQLCGAYHHMPPNIAPPKPFAELKTTADKINWQDPKSVIRSIYIVIGRPEEDANVFIRRASTSRKGAAAADLAIYDEACSVLAGIDNPLFQLVGIAMICNEKALVHLRQNDVAGAIGAYNTTITTFENLEAANCPLFIPQLGRAYLNRAAALMRAGKLTEALSSSEKGFHKFVSVSDDTKGRLTDIAFAYYQKGLLLLKLGKATEALDVCNKSIELLSTGVNATDSTVEIISLARVYETRGQIAVALRDVPEAVKFYQQGLNILNRHEDPTTPAFREVAASLHLLCGIAYIGLEENKLATNAITQGTTLFERLVFTEQRDDLRENLALCYNAKAEMGKLQLASKDIVALYDKTIEILRDLAEKEGRSDLLQLLAKSHGRKGDAIRACGKSQEALTSYDKSIAIYQRLAKLKHGGDIQSAYMEVCCDKGDCLRGLGQQNEALVAYNHAVEIAGDLPNDSIRSDVALVMGRLFTNRGNTLTQLGSREQALPEYDKAIALLEPTMQRDGVLSAGKLLALAYVNKAVGLRQAGDNEATCLCCKRVVVICEGLLKAKRDKSTFDVLHLAIANLAEAKQLMGDVQGGLEVWDDALRMLVGLTTDENKEELTPDVYYTVGCRTLYIFKAGRADIAIPAAHALLGKLDEVAKQSGRTDLQKLTMVLSMLAKSHKR